MAEEIAQGAVAGGLALLGAWLLRWRQAGYRELAATTDRLQQQVAALTQRLDTVEAARLAAEQRAAAAELRAANAEAQRLRDKQQADATRAELREEIHALRNQLTAAGLQPTRRVGAD